MAEKVINEQYEQSSDASVETTDRGLFGIGKKEQDPRDGGLLDNNIMTDKVSNEQSSDASVETTDRGLFGLGKKDEEHKPVAQDETLATEFDNKVQVSEPDVQQEKKHDTLLDKFHQADDHNSSSSSSSDEEGDDEEKKRKRKEKKEKKGLKEKLVEKLPGHTDEEDTHVPIEKPHVQEVVYSEPSYPEEGTEKKGFVEKIKEKIPGQKKPDEHHDSVTPVVAEPAIEGEGGDKKGFLDKIKDKISGLSSKPSEEKKEHVEN